MINIAELTSPLSSPSKIWRDRERERIYKTVFCVTGGGGRGLISGPPTPHPVTPLSVSKNPAEERVEMTLGRGLKRWR